MNTYEQLIAKERKTESVSLSLIRTDGGTQYRTAIADETVNEYRVAIKGGTEFPPLEAVFDGSHYWLYDGFHRLKAMQILGIPKVSIRYFDGKLDDAKLLALTANAKHGLPRNLATKRAIGVAALQCPALKGRTTYDLAKITGLSQPFIQSLRDPEAKARQQEARDKSAELKIKQKVANPISSSNEFIADGFKDLDPEIFEPSEEEIAESEYWQKEAHQRIVLLMDEDPSLKTAIEEAERLLVVNKRLEFRLDAITKERQAILITLKREQRKVDKLEAQMRSIYPTKTEIRIGLEANGFEENFDTSDKSISSIKESLTISQEE